MKTGNAHVQAYIALGSNLDDPQQQLARAAAALETLPESDGLRMSSLYISTPLGGMEQPDYVNAVAALTTRLTPMELLAQLQDIENRQGRVRSGQRWAPRTLDLDLLLYGNLRQNEPALTLPHAGLAQRNFVLFPLFEIAPDLTIPGLGSLRGLVGKSSMEGLRRLEHDHETQAS